jgi:hypothetical protein
MVCSSAGMHFSTYLSLGRFPVFKRSPGLFFIIFGRSPENAESTKTSKSTSATAV